MSNDYQRVWVLMSQERYDLAEAEVRRLLAQNPEEAIGYSALALCLMHSDRFDEATEAAQHAIGLAPDVGYSHYVLAEVLLHREHLPEAHAATRAAISLDPFDSGYRGVLSAIEFAQEHWSASLAAADEGLALDPDNERCKNFRAMALVKLGRSEEAEQTIAGALQQNPDNAFTHANLGWTHLNRRDPKKALIHFREALRLDPSLDFARAGLVEALKARYFVYRYLLAYFLWMMRLSPRTRWGIIVGGYFGYRILSDVAQNNPALSAYLNPLIIAYIVFAVSTWLVVPIFNTLLRLNRFGRYALSQPQVWQSNIFLALAFVAILVASGRLVDRTFDTAICALYVVVIMPAACTIPSCAKGWPRYALIGVCFLLACTSGIVISALWLVHLYGARFDKFFLPIFEPALSIIPWLVIGSQFAANYLVSVRVRR